MTPSVLGLVWFALVVVVLVPAPLRRRSPRSPRVGRHWSVGARRRARRAHAARVDELPDVVDLFVLAVGAGCNVSLALAATARRAPPAWREAMARAVGAVEAGDRVGDALAGLGHDLGEPARSLATALASSARYGTPLLPALERLGDEARRDRRRRAEEAARRLPITLLFPLVLCILPAFALLSLAPAVAGALRLLRP